jgi:hypothetical protein
MHEKAIENEDTSPPENDTATEHRVGRRSAQRKLANAILRSAERPQIRRTNAPHFVSA